MMFVLLNNKIYRKILVFCQRRNSLSFNNKYLISLIINFSFSLLIIFNNYLY